MRMIVKQKMLRETYEVYEDFSRNLTMACKRGCATCCTQNVTMTTLEGYRILQHLIVTAKMDLLHEVHNTSHRKRFQPKLSTNDLADLCLKGKDPPEEHGDFPLGPCPFVHCGECLIYEQRPFACRCFFSAQVCAETACAVVDPFVITVNTVFLQFIEHIDSWGLFGNMSDVLLFLEPENRRLSYEARATLNHPTSRKGSDHPGPPGQLVRNRAVPAFLVPPEDQQAIQPILKELERIRRQTTTRGNRGRI